MQCRGKRKRADVASAQPPPPPHAPVPRGIVKLNVGGRRFITTLSTLQTYPDALLARMFATELQPAYLDEEGYFFIDRDGDLFNFVLGFLRDREDSRLPTSAEELKSLQREADFYGLSELQQRLECEIAMASKKARSILFELSVWGLHTTCRRRGGACNCGQEEFAMEAQQSLSARGFIPRLVPEPKRFKRRPAVVLRFLLDPQEEKESRAKMCEDLEAQIHSALGTIGSADGLKLSQFLKGVDGSVQTKEVVQTAYAVMDPDTSHGLNDHYDMWVCLYLKRVPPKNDEPAASSML